MSNSKLTVGTANISSALRMNLLSNSPTTDLQVGQLAYIAGALKVYRPDGWKNLLSSSSSFIQTSSLVSWLDPTQFLTGASTWQDAASGASWNVSTTTTSKGSDYSIEDSNGVYFINGRASQMEVGAGNLTYECWIYISTTNFGTWKYIIGKSSFWNANSSGIYINGNGQSIGFHTTSTNGIEYSIASMGTGWKHLAGVMDGVGRKLYVNGNLVASDSTRHDMTATQNLSYGADAEGEYGDSRFKYGHARWYNTNLSQTQIQQHYNYEKGFYGL